MIISKIKTKYCNINIIHINKYDIMKMYLTTIKDNKNEQ
jgi:hypothetical protein